MIHLKICTPMLSLKCSHSKDIWFTNAFTLAEVLITLAIIGVVASITIPALMQKIKDVELKTAFKKDFSVINQAYEKIILDNSSMTAALSNCTSDKNTCFKNVLKPYFKIIKDCDSGTSSGNCFTPAAGIKYLNGTPAADNVFLGLTNATSAGLIMVDGAQFLINLDKSDCTISRGTAYNNECGWITMDVNGFKGPNQWGKDIYNVRITSKGVVPAGIANDDYNDCNSMGIACAAKVLQQ